MVVGAFSVSHGHIRRNTAYLIKLQREGFAVDCRKTAVGFRVDPEMKSKCSDVTPHSLYCTVNGDNLKGCMHCKFAEIETETNSCQSSDRQMDREAD